MRRGGRQPEPPGAEVPDNRREQQGVNHGKAIAGTGLQDQLNRQQRNDAERHHSAGKQHAEKIKEP
ncbi:hypothetical protein D3C73_1027710 [compost metagenome]